MSPPCRSSLTMLTLKASGPDLVHLSVIHHCSPQGDSNLPLPGVHVATVFKLYSVCVGCGTSLVRTALLPTAETHAVWQLALQLAAQA